MNSEEKAITRQEAAAMQARIDSTIAAGTIHSGYTKKQVKKAWGTPDYRSCCALDVDFKILYQWVYTSRNYYVYFIGNRCSYIVSFLDAEKERQRKLRGVDPWKRKQNENEY